MNHRENVLKAVRFDSPDYIPMSFHINGACWRHYDQNALQDLIEAHPFLFPAFTRRETVNPQFGLTQRKDEPYTDPWGCIWTTSEDGITGSVHGHPLSDWNQFSAYTPPDPNMTDGTHPIDWKKIEERVQQQRKNGELVGGGLPHGHTFLRLQDMRGYENLPRRSRNQGACEGC